MIQERNEKQRYKNKFELLSNDINKLFMTSFLESMSNLTIIEEANRSMQFIEFYRKYIINLFEIDEISIDDSYNLIVSFLEMIKVQYGDKFEYSIMKQKKYKKEKMPNNIIVPYVQLITLLGIRFKKEKYSISIDFSTIKNDFVIDIEDNGVILSDENIKKLSKIINLEHEVNGILNYLNELNSDLLEKYHDKYSRNRYYEDGIGNRIIIKFPLC